MGVCEYWSVDGVERYGGSIDRHCACIGRWVGFLPMESEVRLKRESRNVHVPSV